MSDLSVFFVFDVNAPIVDAEQAAAPEFASYLTGSLAIGACHVGDLLWSKGLC